MTTRAGFRTLTPYPVVHNVSGMIAFMQEVFGSSHVVEETFRTRASGGYHCEVRIGDCMMMIGGGGDDISWLGASRPMAFHIYVPDVDATYGPALSAGAESLQEPTTQPWGERTANVKDPFGNNWYIATFQGDNYFSEGAPTIQPYLHPVHSAPVIDFLMSAFGAEETGRATSPEGASVHTTVKIGDAAMEFVDAAYRRALEAGATSISEPVDQSYGDRSGGVEDAAGNKWYIATHSAQRSVTSVG